MLWLICLFNYADRQSLALVFPLLEAEFHLTPIQLALVISSFMWVCAGIGWMAGMTGDLGMGLLLVWGVRKYLAA
jgi:hypothetical protein